MNDEIRMTNDELPEGWLTCQLGDVIDYGKTEKAEPYEIGAASWILELEDIEKDTSRLLSRITFAARKSKSTKNRFNKGDVLYGKLRPYLNKVIIADQPGFCTTEIIPLQAKGTLENRYLFYWLKHPHFLDYVTAVSHGLNMPRLGTDAGRQAPFILAPLSEQKRIADKLDALLGRVDACRARLDRLPALLKRFRQSVLAAATSGRLTAEWRMTNGVNDEWEESRVQDVADQVFDGPFGSHLKTADYTTSGIRVARLENIGWMTFFAGKEAFISPAKYKTLTRHTLKKDDMVFSSFISEETRVALLPESWSGKAINKSDCYCVRVDRDRCLPKFLMFRLACRSTYHILGEDVHGATRPRINLGQLKGFSFALPTLPEQQEIVRRVEALFAFADRIEARLATAQMTVERLTPATLAKAFRGELVPQNPADEPASTLLARLRSQPVGTLVRATRKARK